LLEVNFTSGEFRGGWWVTRGKPLNLGKGNVRKGKDHTRKRERVKKDVDAVTVDASTKAPLCKQTH